MSDDLTRTLCHSKEAPKTSNVVLVIVIGGLRKEGLGSVLSRRRLIERKLLFDRSQDVIVNDIGLWSTVFRLTLTPP